MLTIVVTVVSTFYGTEVLSLFPFPQLTSTLSGSWGFVLNPSQCFSECDSGAWGSQEGIRDLAQTK